jgi:hydrogenase-4 component B
VVFLGRPREPNLAYAHDAGVLERVALAYLAAGCVVLGILPVGVIALLGPVNAMLIGPSPIEAGSGSWLLLAPISADRASYSPLIVLLVIVAVVVLTIQVVHRFYHGRVRRAPPWDCGYPLQTPRMQDTAEGFGQPIREVFDAVFRIERVLPTPFDTAPRYAVRVSDPLWHRLYLPLARGTDALGRLVGMIQQGRISVYLIYSFLTLLALLFFVR